MAKKKQKKKRVNKNNIVKSSDEMLNLAIRDFSLAYVCGSVRSLCERFSVGDVEAGIGRVKEIYASLEDNKCWDLVNKNVFQELINTCEELYMVGNRYAGVLNVNAIIICRDKTIKLLKDCNVQWELFIYVTKFSELIKSEYIIKTDIGGATLASMREFISLMIDFIQYILTFVSKTKNFKINGFYNDGNHIYIQYEEDNLFSSKDVQYLYGSKFGELVNRTRYIEIIRQYIIMMDEACKTYILDNTSKDATKEQRYCGKAGFRRLPNGAKASDRARKLAREYGFGDIPEGYTFVR